MGNRGSSHYSPIPPQPPEPRWAGEAGLGRCAVPAPLGSSPAAAAHRPRGLRASCSCVQGMTVPPRPPAGSSGASSGQAAVRRRIWSSRAGAAAQEALCGPSAPGRGAGRGDAKRSAVGAAQARPGVRASVAWGALREWRPRRASGAPWWLGGDSGGGFPGAGSARLSLGRRRRGRRLGLGARARGGRGVGAGFWASLELYPLSLRQEPNQSANLQASEPDVTLSAGRQPPRTTSRADLASSGAEGRFPPRSSAALGHRARISLAGDPMRTQALPGGQPLEP